MIQQEHNMARAIKETAIEVRANWNEALGHIRRAMDDLPRTVAQEVAAEFEFDKTGWNAVRGVAESEVAAVHERIQVEEKS